MARACVARASVARACVARASSAAAIAAAKQWVMSSSVSTVSVDMQLSKLALRARGTVRSRTIGQGGFIALFDIIHILTWLNTIYNYLKRCTHETGPSTVHVRVDGFCFHS